MKTILIIDDDDLCRAPAAELLRRNDWHVLEAGNGEECGINYAVVELAQTSLDVSTKVDAFEGWVLSQEL